MLRVRGIPFETTLRGSRTSLLGTEPRARKPLLCAEATVGPWQRALVRTRIPRKSSKNPKKRRPLSASNMSPTRARASGGGAPARASATPTPRARPIRDPKTLARIRALAIPPAWTDVWICPTPNGHIQATGRDARGRKQYRYHPRWREVRDDDEVRAHDRVRAARCRRSRDADRRRPGHARPAAREGAGRPSSSLLETTLIRVGNEEYAQAEQELRPDHAAQPARRGRRRRAALPLQGQERQGLDASTCATAASPASSALPGPAGPGALPVPRRGRRDARRSPRPTSTTICARSAAATITAKDFRTWAGTVLAAMALREFETFDSAGERQEERRARRSRRSRRGSATRRPSAASATSIRR